AALPMAGPTDAAITSQGLSSLVAEVKFWIFQGGRDKNPSPSRTKGYIHHLRNAGAVVRYTEYPELGHSVWREAIAEPDFFSWLLAQNKSNIHVFAGDSTVCPEMGKTTELSFSEGFFAYQWEYNGQIVPDSTRHTFVAREPGVYRGRFSRVPNPGPGDWNVWSKPVTVTAGPTVPPEV